MLIACYKKIDPGTLARLYLAEAYGNTIAVSNTTIEDEPMNLDMVQWSCAQYTPSVIAWNAHVIRCESGGRVGIKVTDNKSNAYVVAFEDSLTRCDGVWVEVGDGVFITP